MKVGQSLYWVKELSYKEYIIIEKTTTSYILEDIDDKTRKPFGAIEQYCHLSEMTALCEYRENLEKAWSVANGKIELKRSEFFWKDKDLTSEQGPAIKLRIEEYKTMIEDKKEQV